MRCLLFTGVRSGLSKTKKKKCSEDWCRLKQWRNREDIDIWWRSRKTCILGCVHWWCCGESCRWSCKRTVVRHFPNWIIRIYLIKFVDSCKDNIDPGLSSKLWFEGKTRPWDFSRALKSKQEETCFVSKGTDRRPGGIAVHFISRPTTNSKFHY